jgi:outer membrane protein TolC
MNVNRKILITIIAAGLCLAYSAGTAVGSGRLDLDIDKCVEMAVEVNISVLKAGYDLDMARNNVIYSASSVLPTVGLSSTHSKWEAGERDVGGVIITTEGNRSYAASVRLEELVNVRRVMGVFESVANKRAYEQNLRAVRQSIAFTAKQKYLEVLKARRLLAVGEEAYGLSERRLEKAEALLDVGSAVRSDVLRAQVELSSNELDLISARNDVRLAETDLRHFLSIDDEVELSLEDILETHESGYTLESSLDTAQKWRPDIRVGEESLKAAKAAVWKERGGWLPYVRFAGGYDYTGLSFPDDDVGSLWDDSEWWWSGTIGMNLFDGFATFSQVRSAKASRRSAEEDVVQLRRDAALEIKRSFYNVEEARQRVKVSNETVGVAEEEMRLAEERYRLGGGTMLEQIDAQVALSEARTSRIEALYDYLLSQAELERAMGKD